MVNWNNRALGMLLIFSQHVTIAGVDVVDLGHCN